MAQTPEKMESYCSAKELAYAHAHGGSRFAQALGQLQKAVDLVNTKPGAGRPNARACLQLLNQALLSKEDAYWSGQAAIDAYPLAA